MFYAIWSPFDWLVGYSDPRKSADQDRLHGESKSESCAVSSSFSDPKLLQSMMCYAFLCAAWEKANA